MVNWHTCVVQDGTLVNTKSNSQFAKGPDDWRFYNKKTAKEVKALHEQGYKIVIFRYASAETACWRPAMWMRRSTMVGVAVQIPIWAYVKPPAALCAVFVSLGTELYVVRG